MSVYLGTQLLSGIATNTISNAHNLLDFKWADHELSDQSWLRADTFSWQDGTVYSDAFNHLVADYNNGELHTETVGSYTIDYILAPDGHKIVTQYNEATVANIYDETGVAWYYVLDRVDDRFKLPRTKYGFNGLRDGVGNYIAPGLPNITGEIRYKCYSAAPNPTGAFTQVSVDTGVTPNGSNKDKNVTVNFNASISNAIYGASSTVQPPATQMYLYFYVGQFSQSATEQTAGLNASLFNGKVDIDSSWGFPSHTYDNLTLGASGTTYTAPANGYFFVSKKSTAANQWISIENTTTDLSSGGNAPASGNYERFFLPVKSGDVVVVNYNLAGDTMFFRFIYAEV